MRIIAAVKTVFGVMLLFLFSPFVFSSQGMGVITAEINGLKNSDGFVVVRLFSDADAFPMKPDKAFKVMRAGIEDQKVKVDFSGVPFGEYAIAVYHDENANGKLDTNFIGIPNEGLGSSNDAKGKFGPPRFADAKFTLNEYHKLLSINIAY